MPVGARFSWGYCSNAGFSSAPREPETAFLTSFSEHAAAAAAKSLVVSDSVRPHRRKPTRLPRPWDSPGKNTGVGCHCLLCLNMLEKPTPSPCRNLGETRTGRVWVPGEESLTGLWVQLPDWKWGHPGPGREGGGRERPGLL